MWIPVWDGLRQLWVRDDECRLASGEFAFVNEAIPTPLPHWFEAPPGSALRNVHDERHLAGCLLEDRSMRASPDEVVAFYQACIVRGGLTRQPALSSPELPGRCCPGFSAEGATDRFLVNVYQHRDLAFWTVYLKHKNRRWKGGSVPLRLVSQTAGRFTFWIEHEKQECWAPATAVTSRAPIDLEYLIAKRRREREVLPFEAVPSWLRFTIGDNVGAVLWRHPDDGPMEHWTARLVLPPDVDPYVTFDSWLDHLEAHGICCDSEGESRSFYVTVWQQGQMLSAQIQLDGLVRGSIALLNAVERSISLEYIRPRRG